MPVKGDDDGTGDKAQGNPGKGAKNEAPPSAKPIVKSDAESDDGGSSPLVPILIAIAVLAATSIAVVAMRQRRRRSGPDARVSAEAS